MNDDRSLFRAFNLGLNAQPFRVWIVGTDPFGVFVIDRDGGPRGIWNNPAGMSAEYVQSKETPVTFPNWWIIPFKRL